ncbi:hypothetical protein [Streptomyces hainanensis]|uniref:Uncharacterized protein n=1 Tax=Streptomyces hainanensis TaxID=402648 RepID=A0A4R4TE92_9ACTN|nr:hypothetical protein [Streptomyces hainanensis]TDC74496.1 hypothetical protein E1283_15540 [Streptomyces hainanensis]
MTKEAAVVMTMPERETCTAADEVTAASAETAFDAFSAAAPEGWRVELIDEEIHVTPPANGDCESVLAEIVSEKLFLPEPLGFDLDTGEF